MKCFCSFPWYLKHCQKDFGENAHLLIETSYQLELYVDAEVLKVLLVI